MSAKEILAELSKLCSPATKKTLIARGAMEPFYGVKIADLKVIQKRIKKNHEIALELFDSGISDAMYLAGLIAEPMKMTKAHLKKWLKGASWHMLREYTVAWIAAESRFARELALEWIGSAKEATASAGWSTYSSYVAITPDEQLDFGEIEQLLERIAKEISKAPNRVRYTMNKFVISVGGYVAPLKDKAKAIAKALGAVEVDMSGTACKVPDALAYIEKIEGMGRTGLKKKTAIC